MGHPDEGPRLASARILPAKSADDCAGYFARGDEARPSLQVPCGLACLPGVRRNSGEAEKYRAGWGRDAERPDVRAHGGPWARERKGQNKDDNHSRKKHTRNPRWLTRR